jgi:hypothetical protein
MYDAIAGRELPRVEIKREGAESESHSRLQNLRRT